MAGECGHRGDHDLRQGRTDGNDRCADEKLRQMKAAGQCGRTVHKPITALDQKEQADNKQQYRDKHSDSSH